MSKPNRSALIAAASVIFAFIGFAALVTPSEAVLTMGIAGSPTQTPCAPAGSLDMSFDGDGIVITPVGTGHDEAHSVAQQADGKIVTAGFGFYGTDRDF